jgi:adenosylcobinamide-GDP ribazoletransferase
MREALAFLTVLGGARAPTGRALRWFPVIGALLGAAVGAVWWAGGEVLPVLLAACMATAADLALTGLLHVDGLADSADGLLPHADRERRLTIMRRPDVGAFGVAVTAMVLLVRVGAFASRPASILLVVGLWAAARAVVAAAPSVLPYARTEGGLASAMLDERPARWPVVAVVPAAAVAAVGAGLAGAVAVVAVVGAAVAVLALAQRRIGGFTGDVLGAAIVVGETVGLVVAAARW